MPSDEAVHETEKAPVLFVVGPDGVPGTVGFSLSIRKIASLTVDSTLPALSVLWYRRYFVLHIAPEAQVRFGGVV